MSEHSQQNRADDDETIPDQELWSAIRYLDPESDRGACNFAAIIALVVAAFIFCIVYVFLLLRGL